MYIGTIPRIQTIFPGFGRSEVVITYHVGTNIEKTCFLYVVSLVSCTSSVAQCIQQVRSYTWLNQPPRFPKSCQGFKASHHSTEPSPSNPNPSIHTEVGHCLKQYGKLQPIWSSFSSDQNEPIRDIQKKFFRQFF